MISLLTPFGHNFEVRLKRLFGGTKISGGELRRLISQYSLEVGDVIVIFLDDDNSGQLRISLHDAQGDEKRPIYMTDGSSFFGTLHFRSLLPVKSLFFIGF